VNSSIKLGQGLAWAAWLVFILSLFLPMETNNLSGPCAWPCGQPFTDYGWQNASFYALSIIVFMLNFVQVIFSSIFDLQTLGRVLDSLITMGIYAVIGLGQFLIVLAPVWPVRIKKASWRRLHLWVIILSALAALAYSMFPTLRLGVEVLSGYYLWVLSFFLLVVASILVQHRKNPDFGTEEGQ
jgi:hypothetical protein